MVAALLAVAAADNAPYTTPAPAYKPQPSYHPRPAYKAPAHEQSYDEPAKYDFSYDVHGYGDYEPQFNAQEARDGYATQGSYSVVLPDGRTQTVTYRVDDAYSGTIADVTYEGEAQYPAYQPTHKPSYKPAAYKPAGYGAPAYKPTYRPAYKPTYKPTYEPAYN